GRKGIACARVAIDKGSLGRNLGTVVHISGVKVSKAGRQKVVNHLTDLRHINGLVGLGQTHQAEAELAFCLFAHFYNLPFSRTATRVLCLYYTPGRQRSARWRPGPWRLYPFRTGWRITVFHLSGATFLASLR